MRALTTCVSATRAAAPARAAPMVTHRKAPAIQPKLRIGRVDDPLERDADRAADAVLRGDAPGVPAATVQRCAACEKETVRMRCAACEADERQPLRRRANGQAPAAAAAQAAAALSGGGRPLAAAERGYFEPRFGANLSGVRIHTDGRAAAAAAAIGARAYALGADIAFASGEYVPSDVEGRRLLAHELAHVMQQGGGAGPAIRRATYGITNPPPFGGNVLIPVPSTHRAIVDEAIARVDRVVNDSSGFSECHDHFAELCPGGNPTTLARTWSSATIWFNTTPGTENGSGTVNGSDIAYTPRGLAQGVEGLAGTLLHEAGHNCGIPGGATHWHAAKIRNYCIDPGRNELSLSAGWNVGRSPSLLFSYRRLLGDWASGRLKATLGVDLNAFALAEAGDAPMIGEHGSLMAGFQARLGGWGGSRYGGISLRVEGGIGSGRFAVRDSPPGPFSESDAGLGVVLQVGPRAEFLIKSGNAHVRPITVGAVLRLMRPVNREAETLQGAVITLGTQF